MVPQNWATAKLASAPNSVKRPLQQTRAEEGNLISGGTSLFALRAAQEILTHIELPYKAGHVVVFEVLWKHLLGKLALVKHMEAASTLSKTK